MSVIARLRRGVGFCLAATGFLFLLITFTPFVSWYAMRLAGPWYSSEGDILVVLAAAGNNLGILDSSTYWRCVYAVAADRHRPFKKIIVSGKFIAPAMRDFLVLNGIDAQRILVEDQSGNTHENAIDSARILANLPGRKILLTSDSHMFRAHRAFQKQGADMVPFPIPDVIKRAADRNARWSLFAGEVSETAGIVYYYYKGWI